MHTVAVVGAGASGLVAALEAARKGAAVLLFEKNASIGKKILASGAGKCNLTNIRITPGHYHCGSPGFVENTLFSFSSADAIGYFEELGLETRTEPDGRVFTACGRSKAVADVIENEIKRLGAGFFLNTEITGITPAPSSAKFNITSGSGSWQADKVILAAGGRAAPSAGGTDAGYRIAESLGHSITEFSQSLVPLKAAGSFFKKIAGIRNECSLKLISINHTIGESAGELLFTDYGLSGPAILDISRMTVKSLKNGRTEISINLIPQKRNPETYIKNRISTLSARPTEHFFAGLFHEKLAKVIAENSGILAYDRVADIPASAVPRLVSSVSDWRVAITGPLGWAESMVTVGGVSVLEVDPVTLESLKCPGLYLTGELLDVDGDSGGYNLHFAWATGIKAGKFSAVTQAV